MYFRWANQLPLIGPITDSITKYFAVPISTGGAVLLNKGSKLLKGLSKTPPVL